MKRLFTAMSLTSILFTGVACQSDNMSTELKPQVVLEAELGQSYVALDYVALKNILFETFLLAENSEAVQILMESKDLFPGGTFAYSPAAAIRAMEIFSYACAETTRSDLMTGDLDSLASHFLHRTLSAEEKSIINAESENGSFQNLNLFRCAVLASSLEAISRY